MSNIVPMPGRQRGKKPVDLVAASGYQTPQDCVWEAIRELKTFNQVELELWLVQQKKSGINSKTIKSFLKRLLKGGYITLTEVVKYRGNAKTHNYVLSKDVGVHAPRLTKEGTVSLQGRGRENLWRAMKVLNSFDFRELAQAASTEEVSVKPMEAKDYIRHLKGAGYLLQLQAHDRRARTPARYRLLPRRNTGPRPPMVQRVKQVFDPNLNQVMGVEQGGEQ